MADTTIEDLDDISSAGGFNPATDYIIIQRAGGDSYKMLLSELTSGAVVGSTKYNDRAEFKIAAQALTGSRFTFQRTGLFNYNSSFTLNIGFGSATSTFIKTSGSNAINGLLGLIPSTRTSEKILSDDKVNVYADIEYNNTSDYIRFSNIRYQINTNSGWELIPLLGAAAQTNFTASIQADISAS